MLEIVVFGWGLNQGGKYNGQNVSGSYGSQIDYWRYYKCCYGFR